jgi:phage terminase small subunit
MPEEGKLTDKQLRFCDEYLIDLNATQAAIRAGYSARTAAVIGAENLVKPNIANCIQEKKKKLAAKLEITQEMVLEGYRKLAFYDPRKFFDENDNLKTVSQLDDETSYALAGFEITEERNKDVVTGYTKKIKMPDRRGALDSLGRHLGMFGKDNEQKKPVVHISGMEIK